jgi:hypothetical protein
MDDEIHHTDLGYTVSARISTLHRLLTELSELDIIANHAAEEHIHDAKSHLVAANNDVRMAETQESEGNSEFEDTPDHPEPGTFEWADYSLSEYSGQSAVEADTARELAKPFYERADQLGLRDGDTDHLDLMAGAGIEDISTPAKDYRGFTSVPEYTPVVTIADLSSHLLEIVGEEPAEGMSAGAGFHADEVHDGNLERLPDAYDYEREE